MWTIVSQDWIVEKKRLSAERVYQKILQREVELLTGTDNRRSCG